MCRFPDKLSGDVTLQLQLNSSAGRGEGWLEPLLVEGYAKKKCRYFGPLYALAVCSFWPGLLACLHRLVSAHAVRCVRNRRKPTHHVKIPAPTGCLMHSLLIHLEPS